MEAEPGHRNLKKEIVSFFEILHYGVKGILIRILFHDGWVRMVVAGAFRSHFREFQSCELQSCEYTYQY